MSKECKTIGLAVAAVSFGIVLALIIAEITIRLFLPGSWWSFRDATDDWEIDPRVGWRQKARLDVTTHENLEKEGWVVRFQTNEDGLTPDTAQRVKPSTVLRIMIFGDSTVVGRAVPQDQTIHAQLETLLKKAGVSAEVINAGVQGYSTDQVYLRMQQLIPLYRPDVVIYGLCSNDFGGNVSREAYGLPKPVFTVKEDGELQEIPPSLRGDGKIPSFGSGPSKWLQSSALYRVLLPWTTKLRAQFMNWEQRNLLGLAPEFYYRKDALEAIDWSLFAALLKQVDAFSRVNEAEFYFYAHPAVEEVWTPYINQNLTGLGLRETEYDRYALERRLSDVAKGVPVKFIPMIDYFLANQQRGPFHLLPRDPHANPTGYQLEAEVIAQALQRTAHQVCFFVNHG